MALSRWDLCVNLGVKSPQPYAHKLVLEDPMDWLEYIQQVHSLVDTVCHPEFTKKQKFIANVQIHDTSAMMVASDHLNDLRKFPV